MPRYNDPCIFVGCFYPAGSLAPGIYIGIGRLPFALPKDFTCSRRRGCVQTESRSRYCPLYGLLPKTGFDFLSTDGYIPLTGKPFCGSGTPFSAARFLFLHWHKMECLSGERRADRQGNRHENGSHNRFYNGSGKTFFDPPEQSQRLHRIGWRIHDHRFAITDIDQTVTAHPAKGICLQHADVHIGIRR